MLKNQFEGKNQYVFAQPSFLQLKLKCPFVHFIYIHLKIILRYRPQVPQGPCSHELHLS